MKYTLMAGTVAILSTHSVWADNNLEELVVTATRTEQSIGSVAGKVQVIESEELAKQVQPGEGLSSALGRLIPNLGVGTETATGVTQTIRGRNPLFLIDGVPQTDNRNVSRVLDSISPLAVARVEVVTGASSIYGVGGAGGVINIITHSGSNKPEGSSFTTKIGALVPTAEPNSDGLAYNLGQTWSYNNDKFDSFVALEYQRTNNFYDGNGDQIAPEPAQTSIHDSDTIAAFAKLGVNIDDDRRIELSLDHNKRKQDSDYGPNYGGPGVPVLTGATTDVVPVNGLSLDEQPSTERSALTLHYNDRDIAGSQLSAQLYWREREYRFFPFAFNLGASNFVSQSTTEAQVYGGKLLLDTPINDQLNIAYGVDYQVDKGQQSAVGYDVINFATSGGLQYTPINQYAYGPDVDTQTIGVFSDVKFELNQHVLLRAGVRFEDVEQKIHDYLPTYEYLLIPNAARVGINGETKDYNEVLFNVGSIFTLNPSHQVFFNYSEGFELPDLARLLRDSLAPTSLAAAQLGVPGTIIEDINLDAIKVKSYELGWRGNWDKLRASTTLFYNQSDKTTQFNADFSVTQTDQKKKIYGIEASADYFINDTWSVGANGAYTVGKTRDEQTGQWLHLDSIEVSPAKVFAYVAYDFDSDSQIQLQVTKLFDYDKAEQNVNGVIVDDARINGYHTVDVLSQWQLPVGELGVGITNITNRQYQNVYSQWAADTFGVLSGIPAQGRTVGISYQVSY